MNKIILCLLILVGFTSNSSASNDSKYDYGFELDALPYLTGGYYLSGWAGKNNYRIRGIAAFINIPEFTVKEGFEDNELQAYALVIDYFPNQKFEGVWYGGGFEVWDSSIKSVNENAISKYKNYVVTLGAGYIWYFHKSFYLNPWGAIHGVVGGDDSVNVGSRVFDPNKITGEVSLKIGWKY